MGKRQRVEVEAVADSAHASAPGALPFVCYFPTSTPSTDEANKLEFSAFTKATGRGGQQVLVGSRERIDYVGSTNGPEFSAAQPCSYAVGVYDKETGKLQVIPINGGRVCRMEARVRGLDYGPSAAPGSGASDEKTREERLTLNKRLVGVFGSGRRRRQMDAREEGIVRVEKLGDTGALTQILEAQVAQASRDGLTRADVLQRATAVRNVPPHHADASEPGAAYVLDEIIPAGAAAALDTGRLYKAAGNSDVADQLLSSGELSAYAAGRLHLLNDPDKGKVKSRGRNLAFLSALLSLLNGRPELRADPERGGVDALAQRLRMQPALLRECLELFYNGRREGNVEVYERPGQRKELLIAYVLVLAQLLEGGGLAAPQFEALRLELKMKPSDLVQRFREVGSTCQPTLYKGDDGEGGAADGPSTRAYNVILLKGGKTLGECFPGIKVGPKRK